MVARATPVAIYLYNAARSAVTNDVLMMLLLLPPLRPPPPTRTTTTKKATTTRTTLMKRDPLSAAGTNLRTTLVRPTKNTTQLKCQIVFRSVGYQGIEMPGVPFDNKRNIIPNNKGRICSDKAPISGLYVSGWIKRGPSCRLVHTGESSNSGASCMYPAWSRSRSFAAFWMRWMNASASIPTVPIPVPRGRAEARFV